MAKGKGKNKKARKSPKAIARRASAKIVRRRSSSPSSRGFLNAETLKALGFTAAGFVANTGFGPVPALVNFVPVAMIQQPGWVRIAAKGAIAVGGGWAIGKFVNRSAGVSFAVGASLPVLFDAFSQFMAPKATQVIAVSNSAGNKRGQLASDEFEELEYIGEEAPEVVAATA